MIYLDTKMCGYDDDKIGFPSVQTCMAIVAETADRLIGWHANSSGFTSFSGQATTFAGYVQRKRQGQAVLRVYGVTHSNRGDHASIVKELRTVCGAITHVGSACYVVLAGVDSDYVEVRRRGGGHPCAIYSAPTVNTASYKPGHVDPTQTRHRSINPGTNRPAKLYGGDDNSASVVEQFLLLEPGKGLRWVVADDVKSFTP